MLSPQELTIVVPGNHKESIFSIIDEIPGKVNVIVVDFGKNSTIYKSAFDGLNIEYIKDENASLANILNFVLWNKIKTEYVAFLPPNFSQFKSKTLTTFLQKLRDDIVYIDDNCVACKINQENKEQIYFDSDVNWEYCLSAFVMNLQYIHNYRVYGIFNNLTYKHQDFLSRYINKLNELKAIKIEQANPTVAEKCDKAYSIIIPTTKNTKVVSDIKNTKAPNDELIYFNSGKTTICKKIHESILKAKNDKIIIVNPHLNVVGNLLEKFKKQYRSDKFIFSNTTNDEISEYSSVCLNRKQYKIFDFSPTLSFKEIIKRIISNQDVSNVKTEIKNEKIEQVTTKINKKTKNEHHKAKKLLMEKIRSEHYKHDTSLKKRKYSIIMPFMYNGDRFHLFESCIKNLNNLVGNLDNFQITIHEIGSERKLNKEFINKYNLDYIYTKWDDVFHRGWALNVGARYSVDKQDDETIYIFMDGDIAVTKEWVQEVQTINHPSAGWGVMHNLNKVDTDQFIKDFDFNKIKNSTYERTRTPSIVAAAGGITIIPKDIFFKVKGFPEDFKGTWGGNDNAMMHKLNTLGWKFKTLKCTVYHMHHEHQTKRVQTIKNKWKEIQKYNKKDWENAINKIGIWGQGKKVRIAMINYLREDKMINSLKSILKATDIPLEITLQCQGSDELSKKQIKEIEKYCSLFEDNNIIWTLGNVGTAKPRYNTSMDTLEKEADYTLIIDSDMLIQKNTIERLLKELENKPEYGAVSCWCLPNYNAWKIAGKKMVSFAPQKGFNDTAALGTGCVLVRTNVFEKAKFNRDLYIGLIDFLWCMEVTSFGWKLGILAEDEYRALNDKKHESAKYKKARHNKKEIERSKAFFKRKWGLMVG